MDKKSDEKRSSKKLFFIAIGVLVLSAMGVVYLLRHRNTRTAIVPRSPYTLTPSDIKTSAGVAQNFTVTYPVSGGWQNISDTSIYLAGRHFDQWVHYNPMTKSFTLKGATGNCAAGQAETLSTNYLTLNCGASSASGVIDKNNKGSGGVGGNWTVK